MNITYRYHSTIPYSLHDMRINRIEIVGQDIKFYFEYGYVQLQEPFSQVNGNLLIQKIDFDSSHIYFLSENGKYGNFQGKKMELQSFLQKYSDFSFEVLDELYGYNMVNYCGYLSLPNKEVLIDITLSLYYTGDIIYQVKDDIP